MRIVVLDNEAIGALKDPHHPHHRKVLQYIEANRPARRADPNRRTVVPTAVRAEAGWDRTDSTTAAMNRFNIGDVDLTGDLANIAARLRTAHRVSVADAHIGAFVHQAPGAVTVITSDPDDMRAVAGEHDVTIVRL